MTDNEYNQRTYQRMQEELAELDNPRSRYQKVLDDWWRVMREAELEERRLMKELNPTGLRIW